jgi:uncharacterized membrane protein YbhN (UPF0104 family)
VLDLRKGPAIEASGSSSSSTVAHTVLLKRSRYEVRQCAAGPPQGAAWRGGAAQLVGVGLLAFCVVYVIGAWLKLRPLEIGGFKVVYPRMPIVARQCLAAQLELIGAAGIIYFALPAEGNPGFHVVLGAFLLSFSAGLLSQVPGGVGVMEAVFLAVMPGVPATAVVAALLVWRLFYLLLPLAMAIPAIILFERSQIGKTTKGLSLKPPSGEG